MAVFPSPKIKDDSLLLLQQDSQTFKIRFQDLSENVLNVILGGDDITNDGLINISDLFDVNTNIYIKSTITDPLSVNRGDPNETTSFGSTGALIDINEGNRYWMLQWVNNSVGAAGNDTHKPEGEFVLRDPKEFFTEGVSGAIELNTLNDVTTRLGPDSNFKAHTADDSILLCVTEAVDDGNGNDRFGMPDYQPRSLTRTINRLLDPNSPSGGIEIRLDNLIDVNPNVNIGTDGSITVNGGRLLLTDDFIKQLPGPIQPDNTSIKYEWIDEPKQDDDMLVWISDPTQMVVNYQNIGADLSTTPNTALDAQPGWYYAQQYFGPPLEVAEHSDDPKNNDYKGQNVAIGGVRILNYIDTSLEADLTNGGLKIDNVGTVPTNISITEQGVLYTTIPQTLAFRQVIDIDDALKETFSGFGSMKGNPAVEDLDVPQGPPAGGPGFYTTPSSEDTEPSVGDFYVIRYTGTNFLANDDFSKTLQWRAIDAFSGNIVPTGSNPVVKNGDMVVWSGNAWSVFGTINTDTVAQDLQSVTTRGNFTNRGIKLDVGGKGMLGGEPLNIESGNIVASVPTQGTVAVEELKVNQIDFDFFPMLIDPTISP